MKQKLSIILLLTLSSLLVSGCDFFRMLAGRPDSKELERLRSEQLRKEIEARDKARQDSLQMAELKFEDSRELQDSLLRTGFPVYDAGRIGKAIEGLDRQYYIIIGIFRIEDNARRKLAEAEAAGYKGQTAPFGAGYTAVAIHPADHLVDEYHLLKEIRGHDFCPLEAWIYVNR